MRIFGVVALIAGGVAANALVASAGLDAPAPATQGYTIVLDAFEEDGACVGSLATVDLTSGVTTLLPAAPSALACAGDLAFAPDGTLYGLVQGVGEAEADFFAQLVTDDLTTGAATLVGRFGPFERSVGGVFPDEVFPAGGIEFDGSGRLFALLGAVAFEGFDQACAQAGQSDDGETCLYRVDDPTTPEASTLIGATTVDDAEFASMLAASCDTLYTAFGVADTARAQRVLTVSTDDGAATEIGAVTVDHTLLAMAFDRSSTFWGIRLEGGGSEEFVVTLDPAGGSLIDTVGPQLTPLEIAIGLAIEPLDCPVPPPPAPIVLEPTLHRVGSRDPAGRGPRRLNGWADST